MRTMRAVLLTLVVTASGSIEVQAVTLTKLQGGPVQSTPVMRVKRHWLIPPLPLYKQQGACYSASTRRFTESLPGWYGRSPTQSSPHGHPLDL